MARHYRKYLEYDGAMSESLACAAAVIIAAAAVRLAMAMAKMIK